MYSRSFDQQNESPVVKVNLLSSILMYLVQIINLVCSVNNVVI
jgi:hypothetical protein